MTRLDPRRRAPGWEAAPLVAFAAAVAVFDLRFHEFWRDEAGAMLEARAVPWRSLLEVMRLEGVPPLFHALLKISGAVLPDPAALVLVGALGLAVLLLGTRRLLVALSGRPVASAWMTLAFATTYAYAYELGVMVRQYTLGLGFALLAIACFHDALRREDERAVHAGTLAAVLATLTAVHAACLAGGALLSFGLVSLARRRSARFWSPILVALPAFGLVVYLALPFPDRGGEASPAYREPWPTTLQLGLQALISGVLPASFWRVESFVPERFGDVVAKLRSMAFWGVVAGAALAFAAWWRKPRRAGPFEVIAVLASIPPLLVITIWFYWGGYRHHLFLAVPALVVLAGWGLDASREGPVAAGARRAGLTLLAPWFLFQAFLAGGSLALDQRYPFSDTKAAAAVLPRDARLVTDAYWRTTGVMFWRPDVRMRSTQWSGRPYRYIRLDRSQFRRAPLPPLLVEECRQAPDRTFFAGVRGSLGDLGSCATAIPYPKTPFETHPFTWESFDLFKMNCTCVAAAR